VASSSNSTSVTRRNRDELLLDALASGALIKTAAGHAGLSMSTVMRRLRDPGFQRRLQERRAERVTRFTDKLESAAERAISVLLDEMANGVGRNRVSAARALLQGVLSLKRLDVETELTVDPFTAWLSNADVQEVPGV
jgi:hypothetical protein